MMRLKVDQITSYVISFFRKPMLSKLQKNINPIQLIESKFVKFIIVGSINFFITLFTFYFFLKLLNTPYVFSLMLSWAVGIVFTYSVNYKWVFLPGQKFSLKAPLAKYFFFNLCSLSLNIFCLGYLVETYNFDPFLTQFSLIPVIVLFNYTTARYWSLR
jgi:putative flippase GtrA